MLRLALLGTFSLISLYSGAQDTSWHTIDEYYHRHLHDRPSQSIGTVSNGSLKNGHLMPYAGTNFCYFDSLSYVNGRAFAHDKVKKTILDTYSAMETERPGRLFGLMECAHEHGGKLYPHRTHQNGLSVDFMMPLLKNGVPFYGLDKLGADHYWMEFNDAGQYKNDTTLSIDFDLVAHHIILLHENAKRYGIAISKVIIKIELKDELFATPYGKQLAASEIYVVKKLDSVANSLHDDHYHIDFEIMPG